MKKNLFIILSVSLIAIGAFFIFQLDDKSIAKTQNKLEELKEGNDILKKIDETKLSDQVLKTLKDNGYNPTGVIGYQIYPDQSLILISMESTDDTNKRNTEKDIQEIVDKVAAKNNFDSFIVEILTEED
ncbi:hypothetical protein [Bacillus niameyensis]|uniref:hypothetical protein n=1 Tax=Bacillus niameyensis TaxID=1522308 RepID=UPI000780A4D2|nr:hypothetical protein [Bacillus niameyensis]